MNVHGEVAPGFEHVRDAFERGAADLGRGGGAFCAYVDGKVAVDLFAGEAAPGTPWRRDTRAVLMSSTKGAAALCMLLLVDRGELDPERAVSHYWPEYGASGKNAVTVAQLLDHSAGAVSVPRHHDLLFWDGKGWGDAQEITRRLASAELDWEPGTRHGYHALTCGWFWGELVRRITGQSLGSFFRKEIALPLGLELEIGTPRETPVARLIGFDLGALPPTVRALVEPLFENARDASTVSGRAFVARDGESVLDVIADLSNNPDYRAAEVPASNGTATARAVARMYSALALGGALEGSRLCSPASIERFARERRTEPDVVLGLPVSRGLGFWLNRLPGTLGNRMGPHDEAFGHGGAGGQIGFADPVRRVSVGFVRSQLTLLPTFSDALIAALYRDL
jgi:CubicO group peptidase (beta-lactamase class C family)